MLTTELIGGTNSNYADSLETKKKDFLLFELQFWNEIN